jgi:uncharacterized damage-inducible protein DinB
MCPICYKVGRVPIPERKRKKKKLTGKERVEELRRRDAARKRAKLQELQDLWDSLTMELWTNDQRTYRETIQKIKRKESVMYA